MLTFLNKYARNVHSQNGEDGIIAEALTRIGLTAGHAVEIGGNDGRWMSNTRLLLENGWSGLFVEADYDLYLKSRENWAGNPNVSSQCSYVDESNISAFVDEGCDVLSLDTDGSDYRIFNSLKVRPKIVIVEIDSSIPPDVEGFNSDGGAGYFPMMVSALEHGYFLLAHTGNLVLVRSEYKDLFPEVQGHPLLDSDLYFNRTWLKAA